jgi:hypothetical protein
MNDPHESTKLKSHQDKEIRRERRKRGKKREMNERGRERSDYMKTMTTI